MGCQPSSGDTADVAELVTATGWGKPSDNAGGISPVLRMVEDLPIISNSECNAIYGIVGDGVVCIDTTGGKGTCNGDSGGPLNMKFGSRTRTEPLDKSGSRSELSPSEPPLDVRSDTPQVSPGTNTILTGSAPKPTELDANSIIPPILVLRSFVIMSLWTTCCVTIF